MGSSQKEIGSKGRELRALMNLKDKIQNFAKIFCLSLFAVVVAASPVLAQDSRQEQLVKLLAAGNDEQRLDAVIELGVMLSATKSEPQTISSLENTLQRDASAVIRALAANAMESSRDEKFVPVLLSSLTSEREVAVSKAIIYALARHRSAQIVATLLPRLKDKKQDIRAAAAFALAEIGDTNSAQALIELLKKRGKDEDAFARSQAAIGLGKIGDRAAIDVLLNALNRDKSSEVRRESARSLGQIANGQDRRVIEALKQARLQSDPYLVAFAESALERLKP